MIQCLFTNKNSTKFEYKPAICPRTQDSRCFYGANEHPTNNIAKMNLVEDSMASVLSRVLIPILPSGSGKDLLLHERSPASLVVLLGIACP
jgi:hypothetical protein